MKNDFPVEFYNKGSPNFLSRRMPVFSALDRTPAKRKVGPGMDNNSWTHVC